MKLYTIILPHGGQMGSPRKATVIADTGDKAFDLLQMNYREHKLDKQSAIIEFVTKVEKQGQMVVMVQEN